MSVVIVGGNERMVPSMRASARSTAAKQGVHQGERLPKAEAGQPGPADSLHQHGFPQNGHQRIPRSKTKSSSHCTDTQQQYISAGKSFKPSL